MNPLKLSLLPYRCRLKSRLLAGDIPGCWRIASFPCKPFLAILALFFLIGRLCWLLLKVLFFVLWHLLQAAFWIAVSPILIPVQLYRFITSYSTDFAIVVDCAPQEIPALAQTLQELNPPLPYLKETPGPVSLPATFPFTNLRPSLDIISTIKGWTTDIPKTGVVAITKRRTSQWLIKRLGEIQIPARCYRVPTLVEKRKPEQPGFGIRDGIHVYYPIYEEAHDSC